MRNLLLVMAGGGIGAGLRFLTATWVGRHFTGLFPLGTFLVNISGSFAIGVLMTIFIYRTSIDPGWRLFLVTGVLGGYTTFSSFEWEAYATLKGGAPIVSAMNVILSVVLGFAGVWLGSLLMERVKSV